MLSQSLWVHMCISPEVSGRGYFLGVSNTPRVRMFPSLLPCRSLTLAGFWRKHPMSYWMLQSLLLSAPGTAAVFCVNYYILQEGISLMSVEQSTLSYRVTKLRIITQWQWKFKNAIKFIYFYAPWLLLHEYISESMMKSFHLHSYQLKSHLQLVKFQLLTLLF